MRRMGWVSTRLMCWKVLLNRGQISINSWIPYQVNRGQIPINSWTLDQVGDDGEVSGMTLPLVIPAEAGIQEVMDPRSSPT